MPPRIVIVDDDPVFLGTVRLLLESEGFDVVAEALNGIDGVAASVEHRPDLVLVDVNLPDIDGFEVVERIAAETDAPPTVLTSMRSEGEFGNLIGESRARGFVSKIDLSGDALRRMLGGRAAST